MRKPGYKHKVGSYPSKLPRDFIEKTLRRILPSVEDILKLSKSDLLELNEITEELKYDIETNPVKFFQPSKVQEEFLNLYDPRYRAQLVIAGNKFGKSTVGAIKALSYAFGRKIWGAQKDATIKVPNRGCVFAEDFDSHKEVTVPTIQTWAPPDLIAREYKNSSGQTTQFNLANGSIVHFRTYEQGFDKAEGKDWDWVWFDEPPPRDLYVAVFRGLVAKGGILFLTATLVKEGWIYDEISHPFVKTFEGSIYDNAWIDSQAREDFISTLTEDEKQVRILGKPLTLVGLIYKEFRDSFPFVIPVIERPNDCPIIRGIDPHERKPTHILDGWIDKNDRITFFDSYLIEGNLTEHFQQLKEIDSANGGKPAIVIMDPNRGKARQIDNLSWGEAYEERGYYVVYGNDNVTIGHTAVREYFKHEITPEGILKTPPAMQFLETCRGKGGPIHHLTRYSWDDWRSKMQRAVKEQPKDAYKDYPDIIRYIAMEFLTFKGIKHGFDNVDYTPPNWRTRGNKELIAYA